MLIVLRPFRAGDHVVAAGRRHRARDPRVPDAVAALPSTHRVVILPNARSPPRRSSITRAAAQRRSRFRWRGLRRRPAAGARECCCRSRTTRRWYWTSRTGGARGQPRRAASTLVLHVREQRGFRRTRSRVVEAVHNELIGHGLTPSPARPHVYHSDADGRPIADILLRRHLTTRAPKQAPPRPSQRSGCARRAWRRRAGRRAPDQVFVVSSARRFEHPGAHRHGPAGAKPAQSMRSTASRARSQARRASSGAMPSNTAANSSPPQRATVAIAPARGAARWRPGPARHRWPVREPVVDPFEMVDVEQLRTSGRPAASCAPAPC